jgi:hypothetical protein
MAGAARGGGPSVAVEALLAAALGVVLAVAVAGPDLPRLGGEVLGTANMDKWGAVYLHDQLYSSLAAGRLPFHDPDQLWPIGAPLAALNGSNSLEMLVSAALRPFVGWPLWFNLAHLAWIPLNAAAMVPLARRLWPDDRGLRFAAGATWALSPVLLGEMAAGRLTQVALVGVPLAIRAFWDASEGPVGRRGLALGAVGLALTGLGYWYYAVFLGILAPVWLLRGAVLGRGRATLAVFATIGVGAAVLVSPALVAVVVSASGAGIDARGGLDPARLSPVFDNALQLARAQPAQLVGWFPLALAPGLLLLGARAVARGDRRARVDAAVWLLLAALCVVFALGPGQRFGDRVWLLPYWPLWRVLPLLGRLTHPSRWLDLGMVFLVVASFAGLAGGRLRRAAPLVPLALLAQLYVAGTAPLGTFALAPQGVWKAVQAGKGALIVVPLLHSPETCRWQAFHHRPVLGGMVEGLPWAWPAAFRARVGGNPLLMQLVGLGDGRDARLDVRADDLAALRADGFTQIVFDAESWRRWPRGGGVPMADRLSAALGAPLYRGEDGALWDLPRAAAPGSATAPATARLPSP